MKNKIRELIERGGYGKRSTNQVAMLERFAGDVIELVGKQAAQAEPVAWYHPSEDGYDSNFRDHHTVVSCTGNPWAGWLPLYTHAPAVAVNEKLLKALRHLYYNAKNSGAEMGVALDIAADAIDAAEAAKGVE